MVAVCKSPRFEVAPVATDSMPIAVAGLGTRQTPVFGPALHGALSRPPLPRHAQTRGRPRGPLEEAASAPLRVVQSVVLPARKGSPFGARVSWAMPGSKGALPRAWAISRASPGEARVARGHSATAQSSVEPSGARSGQAWAARGQAGDPMPQCGIQVMPPPDWGRMSKADSALAARLESQHQAVPEADADEWRGRDVMCLDESDPAEERPWGHGSTPAADRGARGSRGLRPWLAHRARHRHTQLSAAGEAIVLSPMSDAAAEDLVAQCGSIADHLSRATGTVIAALEVDFVHGFSGLEPPPHASQPVVQPRWWCVAVRHVRMLQAASALAPRMSKGGVPLTLPPPPLERLAQLIQPLWEAADDRRNEWAGDTAQAGVNNTITGDDSRVMALPQRQRLLSGRSEEPMLGQAPARFGKGLPACYSSARPGQAACSASGGSRGSTNVVVPGTVADEFGLLTQAAGAPSRSSPSFPNHQPRSAQSVPGPQPSPHAHLAASRTPAAPGAGAKERLSASLGAADGRAESAPVVGTLAVDAAALVRESGEFATCKLLVRLDALLRHHVSARTQVAAALEAAAEADAAAARPKPGRSAVEQCLSRAWREFHVEPEGEAVHLSQEAGSAGSGLPLDVGHVSSERDRPAEASRDLAHGTITPQLVTCSMCRLREPASSAGGLPHRWATATSSSMQALAEELLWRLPPASLEAALGPRLAHAALAAVSRSQATLCQACSALHDGVRGASPTRTSDSATVAHASSPDGVPSMRARQAAAEGFAAAAGLDALFGHSQSAERGHRAGGDVPGFKTAESLLRGSAQVGGASVQRGRRRWRAVRSSVHKAAATSQAAAALPSALQGIASSIGPDETAALAASAPLVAAERKARLLRLRREQNQLPSPPRLPPSWRVAQAADEQSRSPSQDAWIPEGNPRQAGGPAATISDSCADDSGATLPPLSGTRPRSADPATPAPHSEPAPARHLPLPTTATSSTPGSAAQASRDSPGREAHTADDVLAAGVARLSSPVRCRRRRPSRAAPQTLAQAIDVGAIRPAALPWSELTASQVAREQPFIPVHVCRLRVALAGLLRVRPEVLSHGLSALPPQGLIWSLRAARAQFDAAQLALALASQDQSARAAQLVAAIRAIGTAARHPCPELNPASQNPPSGQLSTTERAHLQEAASQASQRLQQAGDTVGSKTRSLSSARAEMERLEAERVKAASVRFWLRVSALGLSWTARIAWANPASNPDSLTWTASARSAVTIPAILPARRWGEDPTQSVDLAASFHGASLRLELWREGPEPDVECPGTATRVARPVAGATLSLSQLRSPFVDGFTSNLSLLPRWVRPASAGEPARPHVAGEARVGIAVCRGHGPRPLRSSWACDFVSGEHGLWLPSTRAAAAHMLTSAAQPEAWDELLPDELLS
uniref:Uncharacterized protein n=1 Tax=Cafeteria roenbergensis TaxID=33653 RepID=A0A7S0PBQ4_CAFRO